VLTSPAQSARVGLGIARGTARSGGDPACDGAPRCAINMQSLAAASLALFARAKSNSRRQAEGRIAALARASIER